MRFIRLQNRELPLLLREIERRIPEWLFPVAAVTPADGTEFILDVQGGTHSWGYQWVVCGQCRRASIRNTYSEPALCTCPTNDEKLLLAAYTVARQARFDGKDTFHLEEALVSLSMPTAKRPSRRVVQELPRHEMPIEKLELIFSNV